jgi:hypothetical protein
MWREMLDAWAPLYAEPRFFDLKLCEDFTKLTRIPMLTNDRPKTYSILNDPDIGIRLPDEPNQTEKKCKHIAINTIIGRLRMPGVRCVITFDQSVYRNHELGPEKQRDAKMHRLDKEGFPSFYYDSHAPFLFATPNIVALKQLQRILRDAGIPPERIKDRR